MCVCVWGGGGVAGITKANFSPTIARVVTALYSIHRMVFVVASNGRQTNLLSM